MMITILRVGYVAGGFSIAWKLSYIPPLNFSMLAQRIESNAEKVQGAYTVETCMDHITSALTFTLLCDFVICLYSCRC